MIRDQYLSYPNVWTAVLAGLFIILCPTVISSQHGTKSSSLQTRGFMRSWGAPSFGKNLVAATHDNIWKIPGGGTAAVSDEAKQDEVDDDERYSRQVYTLGARAQGLIRTSTIYIDGPPTSGLVYECAKNLALSGVRNIVLWTNGDPNDAIYHKPKWDDLGNAYVRAARAELGLNKNSDADDKKDAPEHILEEYIRRLNPAVRVSVEQRPPSSQTLLEQRNHTEGRGVILCLDRPSNTQIRLNQLARDCQVAFVAVETAGLYGRVFCDFGDAFEVYDMDGETPLVTPLDKIVVAEEEGNQNAANNEAANDDVTLMVHCVDTEKHDVSKGDKIQFQQSNGEMMPETCIVVKVFSPLKFQAELDGDHDVEAFSQKVNDRAVSFSRIKIPTSITFQPMDKALETARDTGDGFTPCDFDKSFDPVRRTAILACFQILAKYVGKKQRLPSNKDLDEFCAMLETQGCSVDDSAECLNHCRNFVASCAAKLTPLQGMFGAIGAQEALKATTGLYNPIQQVLLYDCDELVGDSASSSTGSKPISARKAKSGLEYIMGSKLIREAKSNRLFVVGAGAIGCELLKNLAAMGFGTGENGCIVVTDMDTIERSNLSRQLLFRDTDIGEFKSIAAQAAIQRFNPNVRMEVHTSRVGDTDHGPFNERFWASGVDMVLNALDNMEARLFIDEQCVANAKALIDAGTLGSKGNVQVIVPHQSESYGSSVDPPEPAIPVCTLKNFPYAIAHTIQWGRDLFDGLYRRRPRQAADHAELLAAEGAEALASKLVKDLGDAAATEAAREIAEDLSFSSSSMGLSPGERRKAALSWAVNLAASLFHDSVKELLRQHPVDSLDEDGEPFWSGTRKVPNALSFSTAETQNGNSMQQEINDNLVAFVMSAARLRFQSFASQDEMNSEQSIVSDEEAREGLSLLKDVCAKDDDEIGASGETKTEASALGHLESVPQAVKKELYVAEFEKDDAENGHVQFVTAASNLRAICYGIPPVSAMETRRVAGKIVPAMITTTAVVSALSCLELLKLVSKSKLSKHRNAFINLALPFFAFTMPVPAEEKPGPRGTSFTVWDSIVIHDKKKSTDSKDLSLKKFLKRVQKAVSDDGDTTSIDVASVSSGPYMIYANFLHEGDKEVLRKSLWHLVDEAANDEEDADFQGRSSPNSVDDSISKEKAGVQNRMELSVTVEDTETGEEFELPPVRVYRAP